MSSPTESPTYSESFEKLEDILDEFKRGTLSLEDSLALFEEGIGHLKNCQAKLTLGKGKVEELVKTLQEGGEIVTRPFEA